MLDNHEPLNPPPSLIVDNISVSSGEHPILSNLSFTVPAPSFVAILGPSGIGKSTLLAAIAGIIPLSLGSISFAKQPLSSLHLALMTQKDTLLPWKKVVDNVTLGYRLRGNYSPSIYNKALDLLHAVDLLPQKNAYPDTLSGGMRQRIMLARTLIENAAIVLMDEPFSALDAINRHKIGLLAQQLLHKHLTVMITHDPLEALRLADHIFLMLSPSNSLETVKLPPSKPPRDSSHPDVLSLYQSILLRLVA